MIQPLYHLLDKLLQGRLFEIPDYQRTYSWEKKQRLDLFSDISKLKGYISEADRHHFMATVVCLETKTPRTIGADEFQIFKIVDGQQRLTTLIILLKEIALALNPKDPNEKKAKTDLEALLVKSDRRIILLQTNHDNSNLFKNYLRDAKNPPSSDRIDTQGDLNLANAICECREFVEEWKQKKETLDLLRIVKNRLGFVLYIINDEAPVYTVFEVLNSRGLDVDALDKCKSMLMGIAFEKCGKAKEGHIKELHENWKKIYQSIGKKIIPTDEILRFAATLSEKKQPSETLSCEESLSLFRSQCEKTPNSVLDVSEQLFNIAGKLEELYKDPRREAVTKITHARLLATSISLSEHLSFSERNELLAVWEKITFRIFGMFRKDARQKRGDFTKLAWAIMNNKLDKVTIRNELEKIGSEFPIDDAIKELIRVKNCYEGWGDELRYFLCRYEEYLVKKEGGVLDQAVWQQIWRSSAYSTIEHVFPQEPDAAWRGKMGSGKDTILNNVHRLGNLMLLPPGVNSKISNKSFKEKKTIYVKHSLRMIRDVDGQKDWNKQAIEEREDKLLDWAKGEWA